jgi:hypothetical protein
MESTHLMDILLLAGKVRTYKHLYRAESHTSPYILAAHQEIRQAHTSLRSTTSAVCTFTHPTSPVTDFHVLAHTVYSTW